MSSTVEYHNTEMMSEENGPTVVIDVGRQKPKPKWFVNLADFANMVKAFIGSNYLSVAYAVSQSGLALGVFGMLLISGLTGHCCHLLVRTKYHIIKQALEKQRKELRSPGRVQQQQDRDRLRNRDNSDDDFDDTIAPFVARSLEQERGSVEEDPEFDEVEREDYMKKHMTFGDVGQACFGKFGVRVVNFCIALTQFGFCTGYFIFLGNTIHGLFPVEECTINLMTKAENCHIRKDELHLNFSLANTFTSIHRPAPVDRSLDHILNVRSAKGSGMTWSDVTSVLSDNRTSSVPQSDIAAEVTSGKISTDSPSSKISTESPSGKITTEVQSNNIQTNSQSDKIITKILLGEITTEVPSGKITTEAPPSSKTSEAPLSSKTSEAPPSSKTSEAPPSSKTSEAPPSNTTTEAPPSNITTESPLSNITTESPPSNITTAPPSNTTTVPSNGTTAIVPSNITERIELVEHAPNLIWLVAAPLPIFLMFALIRSVRYLGVVSVWANISILFGCVSVFFFLVLDFHISKHIKMADISGFTVFFGMVTGSFEGIGLVIPIESSMEGNRHLFPLFLTLSLLVLTIILGCFGILGYLKYGGGPGGVEQMLNKNIPKGNPVGMAVNVGICIGILLTFPLQIFPVIEIIERALFCPGSICGPRKEKGGGNADEQDQLIAGDQEPLLEDDTDIAARVPDNIPSWKRNIVRVLIVLTACGLAILLRHYFAYVGAFIGSVGSSVLGFILPCLFHLKACWRDIGFFVKVKDIVIVTFGVCASLVCAVSVIQRIATNDIHGG